MHKNGCCNALNSAMPQLLLKMPSNIALAVFVVLWSCAFAAPLQQGNAFPSGIHLGDSSNCSESIHEGNIRFDDGRMQVCTGGLWRSTAYADEGAPPASEVFSNATNIPEFAGIAGGGWTVGYSALFSGQEGGPLKSTLQSAQGTPGYKEEFSIDVLSAFQALHANQILIWMIDEAGSLNSPLVYDPNTIVWLLIERITFEQFRELFTKGASPSNLLPASLPVRTSSGLSEVVSLSGCGHEAGIVQLVRGNLASRPCNGNTAFEFNMFTGTRDTNHYWYIWPDLDGTYSNNNARVAIRGDRWGGIAMRHASEASLPPPSIQPLIDVAGGNWTVVYSASYYDKQGGPTNGQVTSEFNVDHSDSIKTSFGLDAFSKFEELNANQMLLWMIDEGGQANAPYARGPSDIVWVRFDRITSCEFREIWSKANQATSTRLPNLLSITTSSGVQTVVGISDCGPSAGLIQIAEGTTSCNDRSVFEFSNLLGTRDENHYWYIWPDVDGSYANQVPIRGYRWGGISLRRVELDPEPTVHSPLDDILGGGWEVVFQEKFVDQQGGPTLSTFASSVDYDGCLDSSWKRRFVHDPVERFEAIDANQVLVFMIDEAGSTNYPVVYDSDEVVWFTLDSISLCEFAELFGKTTQDPDTSNGFPNSIPYQTSSGHSGLAGLSECGHGGGFVQLSSTNGSPCNENTLFEYNTLTSSTRDTNHYWYIWPSGSGSYANNPSVVEIRGRRWGGIALRHVEEPARQPRPTFMSDFLDVEGGNWTILYQNYFSYTEGGPTHEDMSISAPSLCPEESNEYKLESKSNALLNYRNMNANQVLIYMIDGAGFRNQFPVRGTDELVWVLLENVSPCAFEEIFQKSTSDANRLPGPISAVSSTGVRKNVTLSTCGLSGGIVQLSGRPNPSSCNQDSVFEFNQFSGSRDENHYWWIWPDFDGSYATHSSTAVSNSRWGGVAVRQVPSPPETPFATYLDDMNGGGWTVVYSELFQDQAGGPTAGDMLSTSTFGSKSCWSDASTWKREFLASPMTTFTSMGATQMIIWMIDEAGVTNFPRHFEPNEVVWIMFDSITSTQFQQLWMTPNTASTGQPSNLMVTTSSGASGPVSMSQCGHQAGLIQLAAGSSSGGCNSQSIFEFNNLRGTRDTNHYWYIWPDMDGSYANNSPQIHGYRWGGISLR